MSSNLVEFLTSKEILIIYLLAAVALLVCFIIYLIERNNEKLKQKHNTRELNKLVEQIKEEVYVYEEEEEYEKPILETIEYGTDEVGSVSDLVKQTLESQNTSVIENNSLSEEEESIMDIEIPESVIDDTNVYSSNVEEVIEVETIEELDKAMFIETKIEDVVFEEKVAEKEEVIEALEDELEYTDIEPDQATAKLELKKIEEELRRQEELSNTMNIALTNYEEQQEEAAIISLDELVKKGKELYERNEVTQYADEGNEPICLQDLEKQVGEKTEVFDEPFIIADVVPENSEKVEIEEIILDEVKKVEVKPAVQTKFKISPVISPVYGIEKTNPVDLELENTANYDKLDEEIKKTNDFLTTLKDLQTKLDNNN